MFVVCTSVVQVGKQEVKPDVVQPQSVTQVSSAPASAQVEASIAEAMRDDVDTILVCIFSLYVCSRRS